MQITLVQTEIEAALRAYILSQINIRDGMKIDITLKATRGDEGTTAIIDITPEGEPAPQPVAAPAVTKVTPVTRVKQVTQEAKESPKESTAAEGTDSSTQSAGATTQAAEPASEAGPGESPSTEGQAEQVGGATDVPAAGPRKSLFGDLSRPKNS